MRLKIIFLLLIPVFHLSCNQSDKQVIPAAWSISDYSSKLESTRVGIVANHTSMVGETHLLDTLLQLGVNINKIFGPEHGFWGSGDAGSKIIDEIHSRHDIEIISLYGKKRKPSAEDFSGLDIIVFDMQDTGARFYTYISTLQYVMEVCAEAGVKLLVLDRPNPNGHYVDGPVLDTNFRSFVGMATIPLVHGMTVGEYALMLNGEGWLTNGLSCDLEIIRCKNYDHNTFYDLPQRPSPNLPNMNSIYLYPSICLFEGTVLSCGRGTDFPFQVFGHPDLPDTGFSFSPEPTSGAQDPLFNGTECFGTDLRNAMDEGIVPSDQINLQWLIDAYNAFPDKDNFFKPYINLLAGNDILAQQIRSGMSEEEIRSGWQDDLEIFKGIRSKYLLYPEE